MTQDNSVQWAQRSDVFRGENVLNFEDVLGMIEGTYRTYSKIYETLGPYNAKQIGSIFPYTPPTKSFLLAAVKRPARGVSDYVFNSMLQSTIKFCEFTKGKKQLITPHPSTHHSAHFPEGTFEIRNITEDFPKLNKSHNQHFKPTSIAEIKADGLTSPIYVENLKGLKYKYMIIRPKLGKLGTASLMQWEVLLYTKNFGFHIEHTDSNLNPRYSGIL